MSENLVIFDCDGVLVDSEFVCSRIFSETLISYGYQISLEECIKRFTGLNEHVCRKLILEESGINIPQDYWDRQQPLLKKAYENELVPLMQPVLEALEALKIPRCVASNSSLECVLNCLGITKQLKYFSDQSIFTSSQVAKPKPAPDLFLFAAKKMGVDPKNCIVIEDSPAGAKAAIEAGMQVLMFLGGSHAKFSWYKNKILKFEKPMLTTCQEVSDAILESFMYSDKANYARCLIKINAETESRRDAEYIISY